MPRWRVTAIIEAENRGELWSSLLENPELGRAESITIDEETRAPSLIFEESFFDHA